MVSNNTPQQGSETNTKSHDLGSSIDPNVIMPTSHKKSTLRTAIQEADGQAQAKKVSPVMVRSYSKDMQSAMERGKNMKDAKHIKRSLSEEKNKAQMPPTPPKKQDVPEIPKKKPEVSAPKKEEHVPIPKKDFSGAPKKTLTFASGAPAPEKPKQNIPKAPNPPYKKSVSIKDQLLATEKEERKPIHIDVQKDEGVRKDESKPVAKGNEFVPQKADQKSNPSDKVETKKTEPKEHDVPKVGALLRGSEKIKDEVFPKVPEKAPAVPKKDSESSDIKTPEVSLPPMPKKDEVKTEQPAMSKKPDTSMSQPVLKKQDIPVAQKEDKQQDVVQKKESPAPVTEASKDPDTVTKVPDIPKKEVGEDTSPAKDADPFESVLFGGSMPAVAPKKDEVKTEQSAMPKKPEPAVEPQLDQKKEDSKNVIEPKKEAVAKSPFVPVGMEKKDSQNSTPATTIPKKEVHEESKAEPKKDEVVEEKKTVPPPQPIVKKEEPVVKPNKEEAVQKEEHHRIEDHVSSEQLRSYKNDLTRIDQDIALLESQQRSAETKKNRLLTEKKDFEQKLKEARDVLDQVIEKEETFESAIHDLEKEELSIVDPKLRHAVEEKRWVQEDLRAEVEKEKWDVQELYAKVQKAIEEKNDELSRAESSYAEFARRISQLTKERSEKKFKVKLGEVEEKKREIENIQVALLEEKRRLERLHTTLEEDEKKFVAQRKKSEEDEKNAESFADKRAFEESRRSAEKSQREIEQKRWETEESLEKVIDKIRRSNEHYTTVSKIEDEIREKLTV